MWSTLVNIFTLVNKIFAIYFILSYITFHDRHTTSCKEGKNGVWTGKSAGGQPSTRKLLAQDRQAIPYILRCNKPYHWSQQAQVKAGCIYMTATTSLPPRLRILGRGASLPLSFFIVGRRERD